MAEDGRETDPLSGPKKSRGRSVKRRKHQGKGEAMLWFFIALASVCVVLLGWYAWVTK